MRRGGGRLGDSICFEEVLWSHEVTFYPTADLDEDGGL